MTPPSSITFHCLKPTRYIVFSTPGNYPKLSFCMFTGEALTIYDVLEKTKGNLKKSAVDDLDSDANTIQHISKQLL